MRCLGTPGSRASVERKCEASAGLARGVVNAGSVAAEGSNRAWKRVFFAAAIAMTGGGCRRETASTAPPPAPTSAPTPAPAPTAAPAPAPAAEEAEEAEAPHAPVRAAVGVPTCTVDSTFSGVFPVAEASAAVEAELLPGVRELVVVSDSGQNGEAIAFGLPDGPSRALTLPLDRKAGDDTEGLAWRAGHLYALTSAGFVLDMVPDGRGGLSRKDPAYPLGPAPFVCDVVNDVNCGKNYEGLCLRGAVTGAPASRPPRCVGYAASRAEGALYCLSMTGDRLAIDQVHPPLILPLRHDSLSDCAFGSVDGPASEALVITTNLHGGSQVYVVDESSGGVSPIAVPGILNDEAVVIDHTGALYQAMDDNGTPSPATRATCRW
jgi:hypothetical protein